MKFKACSDIVQLVSAQRRYLYPLLTSMLGVMNFNKGLPCNQEGLGHMIKGVLWYFPSIP